MAKKAPRRTAERILEAALDLFNRFGEPNVSTTLISAELGISPGNLYYHYPAKDELVNALFDRHEQALAEVLASAEQARDLTQARTFLDALFARIWASRFLYRDLNDLLSRNLRLETRFQLLLEAQSAALRTLLGRLRQAGALQIDAEALTPTATALSVVTTYWLSYEYVRAPRRALEPEAEHDVCERGALHALQLLAPYVEARQSLPSRSARASAVETLAH